MVALATFFSGMAMFGTIVFIPLFGQTVSGESATNSGLILTPMILGAVVSSTVAGQILSRWTHYKYLALIGLGVMTFGTCLLAIMGSDVSNLEIARNMVLVGVGLGVTFPLFTIVVQNTFPYQLMDLVTAFVQFFRSIGGSLGVAIMGGLLASRLTEHLVSNLPQEAKDSLGQALLARITDTNVLLRLESQQELENIVGRTSDNGAHLADVVMLAMKEGLADAIQEVFILVAISSAIAFVVVLWLKEIPLKKSH